MLEERIAELARHFWRPYKVGRCPYESQDKPLGVRSTEPIDVAGLDGRLFSALDVFRLK